MTLAASTFQAVARGEYLERLAALPPRSILTPEFWGQVNAEIQEQLMPLDAEVLRALPAIRVSAGSTKGNAFFLFSYRTFSTRNANLDPVVAGITFTRADNRITIEADVAGEESGDCIASVPSTTVGISRQEILAAARDSARQLRASVAPIVAALRDTSRKTT
jgi:hypothetical protein